MAEKKYQVFISSTFSDLKEERRKILDILLMADCIPAGMEAFVAADVEQFEVIKKVIELCDYYILIIGKRYGSISEQTGLSYTEMEYEYAKELGIPVLVFALDESIELPEEKMDTDPEKVAALALFRQKALTNRLASIWKTQDDLTGAVAISIMRATKQIQRPGWQRAADYDEASLRREIMNLQKERDKLAADLNVAQKQINSLTAISDLAYEDYSIAIQYKKSNGTYAPSYGTIEKTLPELFRFISTEMMGVALTEKGIEATLKENLFPRESYNYYFVDKQLLKKILNQLKALGLLYTDWNQNQSTIFWGLTRKGELERNKMILVRNPAKKEDQINE